MPAGGYANGALRRQNTFFFADRFFNELGLGQVEQYFAGARDKVVAGNIIFAVFIHFFTP
jgi:hypothetical protein